MDEFNQNNMPETPVEAPVEAPVEPVAVTSVETPVENVAEVVYEDAVLPEENKPNNIFGIISLVCGILSTIFICCCMPITFVFSIVAVVMAIIEKSKNDKMSVFSKIGLGIGIASSGVIILYFVASAVLGLSSSFAGMFADLFSDSYYY